MKKFLNLSVSISIFALLAFICTSNVNAQVINNVTSGYGGGFVNPYYSMGGNYNNSGYGSYGYNIFGVSNGMPAGYGTSPYGQFAAMTPYSPQIYSTIYSPYSQFGSGFNSYNPSMYSPYSGSNYGSGYGGGYSNLNLGIGLGLQTGRYY